MARTRTVFRCMSCGAGAPKWSGRCSSCGDWNTLSEELETPDAGLEPLAASSPPTPITQLTAADGAPVPTGIAELDRVLGGGFVPGSVTLLGGEPGVGKSTLVLQALAARARAGARVLYVTGEESADQVRLRAERVDALDDNLLLAAETAMGNVAVHLEAVRPELVVVDSVQTLFDARFSSAPGSVTQVRECAHRLVQIAKATGTSVLLVGHVTKDGQLSGPRVLEHVVDTVLSLDGDRHHDLRILRAVKHRFGSTDEIGMFSVHGDGLASMADPSSLLLGDRTPGLPGSVVVPALEGQRPLLVEVQSLVAGSSLAQPRRSAQGLDQGRLSLLLAVLQQRLGVDLSQADVYAMTVGGVKVTEPAADLAVCLAAVSSATGAPISPGVVACGEVGLGGELRQVRRIERRLAEAARLGFTTAVVPHSTPTVAVPMEVLRVPSLRVALDTVGLLEQ
ncbi:MAG TPA: DNA repair protein RadA [Microthrixaceae bacterium]|nr:DNA repair protein RadA [Microthrixaceae bacterium]